LYEHTKNQELQMEMPYSIHDRLLGDHLLSPTDHLPPEEQELPEPVKLPRNVPAIIAPKTPREQLNAAKKALADGYRRDRDPLRSSWGRVADAKRHLEAIDPKSKEYTAARPLIHEVEARLRSIEKASAVLAKRLMIRQREMLVDEFEFFYLAKGIDARVILSGTDKSCLKMECAPLSEVSIMKIVRDSDFLVYLETAGFRRVTLGDGESFVWTHDFQSGFVPPKETL